VTLGEKNDYTFPPIDNSHTMKTILQTITICLPNNQMEFYGMELRPIKPANLSTNKNVSILQNNGDYITWYEDGTITKHVNDGTLKTWYRCPTMAEAIACSYNSNSFEINSRKFFQFHKDGSVMSHWFDAPYYWSAPKYDAEEEVGSVYDSNEDDGNVYDCDVEEEYERYRLDCILNRNYM